MDSVLSFWCEQWKLMWMYVVAMFGSGIKLNYVYGCLYGWNDTH